MGDGENNTGTHTCPGTHAPRHARTGAYRSSRAGPSFRSRVLWKESGSSTDGGVGEEEGMHTHTDIGMRKAVPFSLGRTEIAESRSVGSKWNTQTHKDTR